MFLKLNRGAYRVDLCIYKAGLRRCGSDEPKIIFGRLSLYQINNTLGKIFGELVAKPAFLAVFYFHLIF